MKIDPHTEPHTQHEGKRSETATINKSRTITHRNESVLAAIKRKQIPVSFELEFNNGKMIALARKKHRSLAKLTRTKTHGAVG